MGRTRNYEILHQSLNSLYKYNRYKFPHHAYKRNNILILSYGIPVISSAVQHVRNQCVHNKLSRCIYITKLTQCSWKWVTSFVSRKWSLHLLYIYNVNFESFPAVEGSASVPHPSQAVREFNWVKTKKQKKMISSLLQRDGGIIHYKWLNQDCNNIHFKLD